MKSKSKPAGKPKPKRGRPSLGAAARSEVVLVRLTRTERAAVEARVKRENERMIIEVGDDGQPATVSSWFRDHGLDPLGLATYDSTPDE